VDRVEANQEGELIMQRTDVSQAVAVTLHGPAVQIKVGLSKRGSGASLEALLSAASHPLAAGTLVGRTTELGSPQNEVRVALGEVMAVTAQAGSHFEPDHLYCDMWEIVAVSKSGDIE
jgi:hypothetical protein